MGRDLGRYGLFSVAPDQPAGNHLGVFLRRHTLFEVCAAPVLGEVRQDHVDVHRDEAFEAMGWEGGVVAPPNVILDHDLGDEACPEDVLRDGAEFGRGLAEGEPGLWEGIRVGGADGVDPGLRRERGEGGLAVVCVCVCVGGCVWGGGCVCIQMNAQVNHKEINCWKWSTKTREKLRRTKGKQTRITLVEPAHRHLFILRWSHQTRRCPSQPLHHTAKIQYLTNHASQRKKEEGLRSSVGFTKDAHFGHIFVVKLTMCEAIRPETPPCRCLAFVYLTRWGGDRSRDMGIYGGL